MTPTNHEVNMRDHIVDGCFAVFISVWIQVILATFGV